VNGWKNQIRRYDVLTMYGQQKIPFRFQRDRLSFSMVKDREGCRYQRTHGEDRKEKHILARNDTMFISPVEPVNLPRGITDYLYVEFNPPVTLEPGMRSRIYVKFPVEFGVFMRAKGKFSTVDIVTLAPQKLAAYGEGKTAVLCKYHNSTVHTKLPRTDPLVEGILEIKIKNHAHSWIELNRAVLNALGMKLYYDEKTVSLRASMEIMSELVAETDIIDKPLRPGMKKAIELHSRGLMAIRPSKFVMEAGV
jgi:hypothetical protein